MLQQRNVNVGGFRELSLAEMGFVSGGIQPIGGILHRDADPMAAAAGNPDALAVFGVFDPLGDMTYNGINPIIPDSMENWWYGRSALPSGEAYTQSGGIYTIYDRNGDRVGDFVETTRNEATRTITTTDGGSTVRLFGGAYTGTSGGTSQTVYLRPAG